uniref:Guanylate cyclase n=1 Tax=Panagrolaimus sp. JU765 TaxID=591449 RepID=A0AC34QAC7_9BILA
VTPLKERIEANGLSIDELNLANIYGYIHLYDALKLYALAVSSALKETKDPKIINDGRFLWNKMRKMSFAGLVAQGNDSIPTKRKRSTDSLPIGWVMMDDLAERAGVYAAFFVAGNKDEVVKVVEMNPFILGNCDGIKNKSGCLDLNLVDIQTGFWPSSDGKLPSEEPACGFRNERCDYTLIIIAASLAIAAVILAFVGFVVYKIMQNKALDKIPWKIFRDDMRIVTEEEMKSMLSIGSTKTKLSNMTKFNKHHAIIGTNTHASFHIYPQKRPIVFGREDMQTMTMIKQAVHDNLNPFLG